MPSDLEQPETVTLEEVPQENTAPELTQTETQPEEVTEPKTYTSWREALADAPPDELLQDDRIAGRIGQVADKRAREIAAKQKADDDLRRQQDADRAEEARLRALRQDNPVAYASEMERRDATADAIKEEAARQARMASDVGQSLAEYVKANYSKETYESLAGKTYEGTYAQGITAYIDELNKAERSALRAQWEKDELPKLRKVLLTELNGGEPPIDASTGDRKASPKFNSNLEASTALMDGKITIQDYTRLANQNGWR